jgi:tRNA G26 N,N-dimethylase Trm1
MKPKCPICGLTVTSVPPLYEHAGEMRDMLNRVVDCYQNADLKRDINALLEKIKEKP